MKKLFLSLIVAACSVAASAQVYVGGQVGVWRNSDANKTTFNIVPEVGYKLSDKVDLGLGIGYNHYYKSGLKTNGFGVSPYVRYTFAQAGPVSFFLNGGFGFYTYKTKVGDVKGDAMNSWEIGIKPGVKVSLTKKIDFLATMGFLGYRDNDDAAETPFGEKGFGFKLSSNDLNFGLIYNF